MDYREEDLQKFHEYVRALEAERHKIQMFQRELPLCLDIVTQTIESYKQQLSGTTTTTTTTTATAQGSEQTTSEGPVFEEFIPLKRTCSSTRENEQDEDDDEELGSHKNSVDFDDCAAKSGPEKKLDWLSSVQLWNQSPDPASTANKELPKKVAVVEVMRNGSAFDKEAPTSSGCSSVEKKEDGGQQRKSRRCWSPELHRRFLNALDHLGGSHAATPKQIRDLMKVDGLTNDEVKSHLQKYRLHSRRPASTSVAQNNNVGTTSSAPQLVVVGGIWMAPPPPHQAGISGPPAPAGQPDQQRSPQRQQSQSSQGGAARCNSSANSSSTRTVTASPAY